MGASNQDFCLARYTTSGVLDPGFGSGGKVITPMGTSVHGDFGEAVSLQSDGKVVLSGYCYIDISVFCLARYSTAGVLDTTYGTGGKVFTPIGASYAQAHAA